MAKHGSVTTRRGKGLLMAYDDTNRGVLFDNDKDGVEARPDMTGHIFINPADYVIDRATGLIKIRLAAWSKKSDRVGDYLSLSASPAQD